MPAPGVDRTTLARPARVLLGAIVILAMLVSMIATAPRGTVAAGVGATLQRVRVGIASTNPVATGGWVAKDRGFFRKYGVETEFALLRGSTQAVQALVSGTVDLLMAGAVTSFPAVAAGADLVEIATMDPIMPYIFVGRLGLTSPSQLRGKKVAVSGTGLAVSRLGVMIALRQFGLDAQRDNIVFVLGGTTTERLAGLASGAFDATVIDVSLRAKVAELKLPVLADLAAQKVPFEDTAVQTTRRFLAAHGDAVEGWLKGLLEGNAYVLDPANRRVVTRVIASNLHYDTVAEADEAYKDALTRTLRKPYPYLPGLVAMLEAAKPDFPELARVDLNTFVDASLLRKLDQNGFIDRLTPRR